MKRKSTIAITMLLWAGAGNAMTGQELLQLYDSNKPGALRYVYGVVDGAYYSRDFMEQSAEAANTQNQFKAVMRNLWGCAYGANSNRIGEIVYAYILLRPDDQRSFDAVTYISAAISSEWPCQHPQPVSAPPSQR
jgi:hypothetical protein